MVRLFAVLLLALVMTACGPALGTKLAKPTDTAAYGDSPRYTVKTGETAVTNGLANVAVGFEQKEPLKGSTSHRGKPFEVSTKPCLMIYFASDHAGDFYACSKYISVVIKDRERTYAGGVYIPYKPEDEQQLWWAGPELLGTESRNPVPQRAPSANTLMRMAGRLTVYVAPSAPRVGKITKQFVVVPDVYIGRGFASTLTYLGMASGKILFSYREFIDGQARPAFSQDIELDYRPAQTYTYKNAKFMVHEATVEKLDMTLIQPM